jgi:hypothetical protein
MTKPSEKLSKVSPFEVRAGDWPVSPVNHGLDGEAKADVK